MASDNEYVLGTHDDEIVRLGLQHRVWRPRALDAWRRSGISTGQTILDIGCGPGYASLDLAAIVGTSGRIVAMDRSRRFLDALGEMARQQGLTNITPVELDLSEARLPVTGADSAWCRWVFAFVSRPQTLLAHVGEALKPGGKFVIHEYFDYATWKVIPRSPEVEEFVKVVMQSWRDEGGEPDIGLQLPVMLEESGFDITALNPIIDIVPPTNFVWQWPKAFIEVGLKRLSDLGYLTTGRAQAISEAFAACEASPHALMVTPAVLEIVAVRR